MRQTNSIARTKTKQRCATNTNGNAIRAATAYTKTGYATADQTAQTGLMKMKRIAN
jgi:hypothetical protein